jgi:flagellar biosynthesis/type III secretory pathway M-ring protein FliF/YscJ
MSKFWNRMSKRQKIIVCLIVFALFVLTVIGALIPIS